MRAVLAVIAGYAAWTILWLGLNATLAAVLPDSYDESGVTNSAGLLVGTLAASAVISVVAGWLTARIATPRAAVWTAAALLLTGIGVQISYWSLLPVWYHLAFLILLAPATIFGGSLRSGARPAVAA